MATRKELLNDALETLKRLNAAIDVYRKNFGGPGSGPRPGGGKQIEHAEKKYNDAVHQHTAPRPEGKNSPPHDERPVLVKDEDGHHVVEARHVTDKMEVVKDVVEAGSGAHAVYKGQRGPGGVGAPVADTDEVSAGLEKHAAKIDKMIAAGGSVEDITHVINAKLSSGKDQFGWLHSGHYARIKTHIAEKVAKAHNPKLTPMIRNEMSSLLESGKQLVAAGEKFFGGPGSGPHPGGGKITSEMKDKQAAHMAQMFKDALTNDDVSGMGEMYDFMKTNYGHDMVADRDLMDRVNKLLK